MRRSLLRRRQGPTSCARSTARKWDEAGTLGKGLMCTSDTELLRTGPASKAWEGKHQKGGHQRQALVPLEGRPIPHPDPEALCLGQAGTGAGPTDSWHNGREGNTSFLENGETEENTHAVHSAAVPGRAISRAAYLRGPRLAGAPPMPVQEVRPLP